jgi:ribosomal protein S27AE
MDMGSEKLGQGWQEQSEEVISGMREWREQHPKATFREIETELDERLSRLRAKMLQDTALSSSQADWSQLPKAQRPVCPQCGTPLHSRGKHTRHLQTDGGQEVTLQRTYGTCPKCGGGVFPPR